MSINAIKKSIQLTLPWPPSINHYWRHTRNGHYISHEGKTYRGMVQYLAMQYRGYFIKDDRLSVQIDAFPPDKRKRDIDNLIKAVLDALQNSGIYPDDFQVDKLSIKRNSPLNGRITVNIETL